MNLFATRCRTLYVSPYRAVFGTVVMLTHNVCGLPQFAFRVLRGVESRNIRIIIAHT